MKVVVLAGGFGGARFARALAETDAELTVIGNVGDDEEILGLHISPDLDSILYSLAGIGDEERGWGRADETWNALETVKQLGGEAWFQLGDRDLGLHLLRTQALRTGEPLSSIMARFAGALGIEATVLPATDDELRTHVETPAGDFTFQEWYVGRRHEDEVTGVRYEGEAQAAPGVVEALEDADLIAIAPEQPVPQHRADTGRRRDPQGDRVARGALGRRQPAYRRPHGEGPCCADAAALRGRHLTHACR